MTEFSLRRRPECTMCGRPTESEVDDRLDRMENTVVILGSYLLNYFQGQIDYETQKREFLVCVQKLEESGAMKRIRERMAEVAKHESA